VDGWGRTRVVRFDISSYSQIVVKSDRREHGRPSRRIRALETTVAIAPTSTSAARFSTQLREATEAAHREAERSTFVEHLTEGRLPLAEHARFVRQLHAVYTALEEVTAANHDPALAPLLAPELARERALRADLEYLAGPEWRAIELLAATDAYAERIREVGAASSSGLLAHHYVRYLGDLSGGQVLGRAIARVYDLPGHLGTTAYRFDAIASPKAFKQSYRASLDALPWDQPERDRATEEANVAFQCNARLFSELSASRVA
jgi:heme oxygenase